ncbi:uncharacterized protein LOC134541465 isoform X2 [Bacillus rossius redtenbacheri]
MGSPEAPSGGGDDVQLPPPDEGPVLVDSDSEEEEEEALEENGGYILLTQSAVDLHSSIIDDGGDSSSDGSGSEEYLDAECEFFPEVEPEHEISRSVTQDNMSSSVVASSAESASNHSKTSFDAGTGAELRELWSGAATRADFELGADKIQAVREAMSRVALPPSSVPGWAAAVPEEQWRQQIMDRVRELRAAK